MDDTDELIIQLCTRVGMIMEDACMAALTIGRVEHVARQTELGKLEMAADRIAALLHAAKTLLTEVS